MLEAARPRDVFDDPFADDAASTRRPLLLVLDDGADDPVVARAARPAAAPPPSSRGVRVETVDDADAASEVARYASLSLPGATRRLRTSRVGLTDCASVPPLG